MPRVKGYTPQQRAENKMIKLRRLITSVMKEKKITQTELGEAIGLTQQGFGYALKNMNFTTTSLFIVLDMLGISIEWEESA